MNKTITLDKHEMVIDKEDYESLIKELKELRKLKLSKKKLEDIAYKIATGNCTTTSKSKAKWEKCDTSKYLWEPFEDLSSDFTEKLVASIAFDIVSNFKNLIKE